MKSFDDTHNSNYYDTLSSHCPDPISMTRDKRPILRITWGPTTWSVGDLFCIRNECRIVISKIVAYRETGRPWVAFYARDEIVARADCIGAFIGYI